MDIDPFFISFYYDGRWTDAKIRPSFREDSVVDYAVWIKGRLELTITKNRNAKDGAQWVAALQNTNSQVNNEFVTLIGTEIDHKNDQSSKK